MAYLEVELPLDYEEEIFAQVRLTVEKGLEIQLGREEEGVVQTAVVIQKTGRKVVVSIWPEGKDFTNQKEGMEIPILKLSGKN